MGDFRFLHDERTGDLVRIAINRPPFNVLDIPTMAEMNLALERAALLHTKRAMRVATGRPFAEALHDVEQIYLKELMATEDATEGLNAFMEKRKPVWKNR